jgi:hypothetical protein
LVNTNLRMDVPGPMGWLPNPDGRHGHPPLAVVAWVIARPPGSCNQLKVDSVTLG